MKIPLPDLSKGAKSTEFLGGAAALMGVGLEQLPPESLWVAVAYMVSRSIVKAAEAFAAKGARK